MKKRCGFIVDLGKAAVCLSVGAVLSFAAAGMIYGRKWTGLLIFLVIALLYLGVGIWNASKIYWDVEGVSRKVFGIRVKLIPWSEIQEVGIMGTKVFNRKNPMKTGRMYIYFSEKTLSDKERFSLMLRWPPLNKIYLLYQADRVEALRYCYTGKIETYNVGGLEL